MKNISSEINFYYSHMKKYNFLIYNNDHPEHSVRNGV